MGTVIVAVVLGVVVGRLSHVKSERYHEQYKSHIAEPSKPLQPDYWDDEAFCDHCDKETMHTYHSNHHERDSSGDWKRCQVCKWTDYGGRAGYEAPWNEEEA